MIKKIKMLIIISILIIISLVLPSKVLGAEPKVSLEGDSSVTAGESGTLLVKVNYEDGISGIQGKVEYTGNITGVKIEAINGFTFYGYEEGDTSFIAVASGETQEAKAVKITYTTSTKEGTGTITLKQIKISDKNDATNSAVDATKSINIVANNENPPVNVSLESITITKIPTKIKYLEGEKFDKTGMEVTAKYSNGVERIVTDYTVEPDGALSVNDKIVTISLTKNGVTKTAEQEIIVTKSQAVDNNNNNNGKGESDKAIPQTGSYEGIVVATIATGIAILSVVLYFKNKKYKGI